MSLEEIESVALKMSSTSRAALAERLWRSLDKAENAKSMAMKTLFATWDAEDETADRQELEARQEGLEAFQETLNANRPSERPLYP